MKPVLLSIHALYSILLFSITAPIFSTELKSGDKNSDYQTAESQKEDKTNLIKKIGGIDFIFIKSGTFKIRAWRGHENICASRICLRLYSAGPKKPTYVFSLIRPFNCFHFPSAV